MHPLHPSSVPEDIERKKERSLSVSTAYPPDASERREQAEPLGRFRRLDLLEHACAVFLIAEVPRTVHGHGP